MKRTIRLTESELRNMISESVKRVLNEDKYSKLKFATPKKVRKIESEYGTFAVSGSWLYYYDEDRNDWYSIPFPSNYTNADDKTIINYAIDYLEAKKHYDKMQDEEDDEFWYN